jgi:hypothetical protein
MKINIPKMKKAHPVFYDVDLNAHKLFKKLDT